MNIDQYFLTEVFSDIRYVYSGDKVDNIRISSALLFGGKGTTLFRIIPSPLAMLYFLSAYPNNSKKRSVHLKDLLDTGDLFIFGDGNMDDANHVLGLARQTKMFSDFTERDNAKKRIHIKLRKKIKIANKDSMVLTSIERILGK